MPTASVKLQGVSHTSTSVLLSWEAPDDHGTPITHVAIQVIPAVGRPSELMDVEVSGEDHEVSGLSPGMAYTFRVKSKNVVGYGPFSDESDPVTTLREFFSRSVVWLCAY